MRTMANIRGNGVPGQIRVGIETDPKSNGIVLGVCDVYAEKVIASKGSRFWALDGYVGSELVLVMRCDEVWEAGTPVSDNRIWEASPC